MHNGRASYGFLQLNEEEYEERRLSIWRFKQKEKKRVKPYLTE